MPDQDNLGSDSDVFRQLILRMLSIDSIVRLDINEVIEHLTSIYKSTPLPPLTRQPSNSSTREERVGNFRTDSQGVGRANNLGMVKTTEVKKLSSNSAAARRMRDRRGGGCGAVEQVSERRKATILNSLSRSEFTSRAIRDRR